MKDFSIALVLETPKRREIPIWKDDARGCDASDAADVDIPYDGPDGIHLNGTTTV